MERPVSAVDAAKALRGLLDLIGNSSPAPHALVSSPEASLPPTALRSGRVPAPVQAELPIFDLDAYMNFSNDEADDDDDDPDFRPTRKAVEEPDEYVIDDESDTASGDEELITACSLASGPYASTAPLETFDLESYLASMPQPLASTSAIPMQDAHAQPLSIHDFNLPLLQGDSNPFMLQSSLLDLGQSTDVTVQPNDTQPAPTSDKENATQPPSLLQQNSDAPTSTPDPTPAAAPVKRGRGRPRKDANAPKKPKPEPRKVIPPEMRAQVRAERNREHARKSKERKKQVEEDLKVRCDALEVENAALKAENERLKAAFMAGMVAGNARLQGGVM